MQEIDVVGSFFNFKTGLQALADYCIGILTAGDPESSDLVLQGAAPQPSNYRNVAVVAGGFVVRFAEYQVACYAAGEQDIFVPSFVLAPYISKTSALGQLV